MRCRCVLYLASTWALQLVPAPRIGSTFALSCGVIAVALFAMPEGTTRRSTALAPWWDIPLRMTMAAVLVLALSSLSSVFGAQVSGLLTPFPITSTILVSFTHYNEGAAAASQFLRGLLKGLFSFAVFVLVVGLAVTSWSIAATFFVATIVTLVIHTGVWRWVQHRPISAADSR